MKNSLPRPSTKIHVGRVLHDVQLVSKAAASSAGKQDAAEAEAALKQAYERGLAAGKEEARRELASALAAVEKMSAALQREAVEMRQAADRLSTQLALRIAAKVIGQEVSQAETVKHMIGTALVSVPLEEGLTIRLNPQDLAVLEPLRGKLLKTGVELPKDVVLTGDPGIERGGCIIGSRLGQMDARVETQMAFIKRALSGEESPQG